MSIKPVAAIALAFILVTSNSVPSRAKDTSDRDRSLIYVANQIPDTFSYTDTITTYEEVDASNAKPDHVFAVENAYGLAIGGSGAIYALEFAHAFEPSPVLNVYPNPANGEISRSITCHMEGGSSIAVNRRGFIYVSGSEGITIFGPSDNGCVKTPLMISGPKTHLINAPVAVALDGYGNIYACYGGIDKSTFVAVFKANSSGDVSPIRMISGDNTRLSAPIAMTVDSFGNVYVLNQYRHGYNPPRPQFITGYRAGANGNVAPITTLIGPATEFNGPDGIGVSNRTGRLFVSNRDNSTITVYEAGASGNVAPIQVIGGFNTGLNQPTTLTVYEH